MALWPARRLRTVGNPLAFDRDPGREYGPPPARCDATEAVLRELAFGDAEIVLQAHTEQAQAKALTYQPTTH